jgi:hypothetical protein
MASAFTQTGSSSNLTDYAPRGESDAESDGSQARDLMAHRYCREHLSPDAFTAHFEASSRISSTRFQAAVR